MIGVLHPGSMGATMAAQARGEVLWCPDGRSANSRARAEEAGLVAAPLDEMVARSEIIISLCPPAAAEEVARQVSGFRGIYVEANAISPERVGRIAAIVAGTVVDGTVIGPPPTATSGTRLYLSGDSAAVEAVSALFAGSHLETRPLSGSIGQASGLKLAFASYNKASRALAAVAHALAAEYGVLDEIIDVAAVRSSRPLAQPGYGRATASAWRWGQEMHEIADTLRAAGLPDDFARAAATVFRHWEHAKDTPLGTEEALLCLSRLSAEDR